MAFSRTSREAESLFVCYRRSDSADTVDRIYERLRRDLGQRVLFRDIDSIPVGVDFPAYIAAVLRECCAVLVVIGPGWLEARHLDGRRRLDDPQDHVRVEVETALRAGNIRVIPVLVRYASMPKAEEVPESVRALVTRNGVSIRPNPDFQGDVSRLAKILRDLIAEFRKLRGKQPNHDELLRESRGTSQPSSGEAGSRETFTEIPFKQTQWRSKRLIVTSLLSVLVLVAVAAGIWWISQQIAPPTFVQNRKLNSVAVTVGDFGNPFFVQIAHGAEAQAKKYNPAVKFTAESSNYDVNNQMNQMDNFISSRMNLILLWASDSKRIAPAVMRAQADGIVVVAVDVGAEGGVDATVTSNNKEIGELAGKYVADRLKGKGRVVIVNGPPLTAVTDRVAGFLEVVKKSPDIKILSQDQNAEGRRDGGLRVMMGLLTAFPKIDAVFAINDPTAIGCDLAAKQAQRKDFFIVGVDGAPDVVPSLKDPNSLIAASVAQEPYTMGGKAVEIGYNIMNGKKPEQALTLVPVDLITKENVDLYKGWSK